MDKGKQRTVLFITGAFVGNNCWDEWRSYFEDKGYRTLAPAWPHKDGTPESLRNSQSNTEIASNRLSSLTDHFAAIAEQLPEKPVLIGHSIGGLIVQILLQKGSGSAGVAIHSVPPKGIITLKFSFLRAGWKALGFFSSTRRSYLMSFKTWQYAFANSMNFEAQKDLYYRYVVPESKMIVRDTLSSAAKIDFMKLRPPLLLISGTNDHSIPSSLNLANYRRYRKNSSVTDYKEFVGRNHLVLAQQGWKENADFILTWLKQH
ncbi:alpha/beta hydrolase [Terrimonas sp. NA20]|uniref:Alpha/beta hydrolase n=1 Tax=Terrimonas ginsenosidimutans TaxID=2908004 RepID=A0ABS9KMC4_9BACT|nr:alpha/beta hydrolase [Terrimonas ginsenosidimutans]MCG2613472.1 alpha/beta hydrolase [Terrimonas ginsenosidimutans]